MAKQSGLGKLEGSLGNLTFYKREGRYLVRRKTSLNRNRFRTDPAFANSRKSASVFGQAVKIVSDIYPTLLKEKKQPSLFGILCGKANQMLHNHMTETEVRNKIIKLI